MTFINIFFSSAIICFSFYYSDAKISNNSYFFYKNKQICYFIWHYLVFSIGEDILFQKIRSFVFCFNNYSTLSTIKFINNSINGQSLMNKLAVSRSVIFSSVTVSRKDPFGGQKSFNPNWTASMNPAGRNSNLRT